MVENESQQTGSSFFSLPATSSVTDRVAKLPD